jgi:ankyrin repeat protein
MKVMDKDLTPSLQRPPTPLCARRPLRALGLMLLSGSCLLLQAGPARAEMTDMDRMNRAVKFDDIREVRSLLAQGMDPNAGDDTGMPWLVIAAREKSDKTALALLDNPKINVDALDRADENALMYAAINKDLPLVKALIDKDAEVNKKGWTPLHYAATSGDVEIINALLEESAYVDAASPNGTTPLMMAARAGSVDAVNALLTGGADPTLKNQLGLSAVDFARQFNNTELAAALAASAQEVATQRAKKAAAPASGVAGAGGG